MGRNISVINVRAISPDDEPRGQEISVVNIKKASYWNALYVLLILGISILTTSIFTLIPRHNSMAYPEYWFEMAIMLLLVHSSTSTIGMVSGVFIFMDISKSLASGKVIFNHYLRTLLAYGIPYAILCFGWTKLLQFNHPMPFLGYSALISWIITLPFAWFLIPSNFRKIEEYKNKTFMYIVYQVVWMMITIQKMFLMILFKSFSDKLQFLMSILVPICRSFDTWVLSKLVVKMSGDSNELAHKLLNISIIMDFAVFVVVMLASANDFTVYCMLGAEFLIHIKSCYHIIRNQNKLRSNDAQHITTETEVRREIEEVILSEAIEALIPLAYAVNFATAYYGPNSRMIGNVRAEYWAFKEVEDPDQLYFAMALMFLVDVGCIIATGFVLQVFGKINMMQRFLEIMNKYWWLLVIKLAGSGTSFLSMFAQNDINNGCDFTFKFVWITDEGRLSLIQNATDLTNDEKMFLLS